MNESPNRRGVVVGLFVIFGLTILIAGVTLIGSLHKTFENKINLVSIFDDVSGLQKGNNVWFSGVSIGTVNSLHFYGKSEVKVIVKIDKKAQQYIHKDSRIKLGSDGFIGNRILIIYGGTEKFAQVQSGDTLEVEKTFSSEDMINTLQENNKNLSEITADFKIISEKLVAGEGTLGKLLNDNSIYANINNATESLLIASGKAQQMVSSLAAFSSGLNKEGTLAKELTTDTIAFNSFKESILQLKQIADTAAVFLTNLKKAGSNPNTSLGVLMNDEQTGAQLKETINNLENSSKKLDEDLEAVQQSFLLRGFFKKKAKEAESKGKTP